MKRRDFLVAMPAAALLAKPAFAAAAHPGKKGVLLMNRIGPSSSELYISDLDGSNAQLSGGWRYRQNIVSCCSGTEPDTKDWVGRNAQSPFDRGSCCGREDRRAAPDGIGDPL